MELATSKFEFDGEMIRSLQELEDPGTNKVLNDLLTMYYENMPLLLSEISRSLVNKNFVHVAHEAHKLKASCGNLGLTSLYHIFVDLEALCRQPNPSYEQCEAYVQDAHSQFEQSKEVLNKVVKPRASS